MTIESKKPFLECMDKLAIFDRDYDATPSIVISCCDKIEALPDYAAEMEQADKDKIDAYRTKYTV